MKTATAILTKAATFTLNAAWPLLAVLAAGALLLVGPAACTGPNTVERDPDLIGEAYPRVTYQAGLSDSEVVYDRPIVRRSEDGRPIAVTVPLRSLRDEPVAIQYRFEFYDYEGLPIEPLQDWTRAIVPGRSRELVSGNATSLRADDWRLVIRRSRVDAMD